MKGPSAGGGCVVLLLATLIVLSGCESFTSAETRIERAKESVAQGEYRTAMIELKKALQSKPSNQEARLLLGQISLAMGNAAAAEKELRHAQALGASDDQVLIPLGRALLAQGDYETVLDEIETDATASVETQLEVYLLHGDAYLGLRNAARAERAFRHALERQEQSLAARIGLAKTAMLAGKPTQAARYVNEALTLDPDYVAAWLVKGELAITRRAYAGAEEAFRAVLADDTRPTVTQMLSARLGLAEAQWRQGQAAQALESINAVLNLAPNHPGPLYLRAVIAYDDGDYRTAVEHLQRVLAMFPEHKPSRLLFGAAQYAQGNLEQAASYLSSVVASDPTNLPARKLLAATRLRQREPGEALATLAPAARAGTGDSELLAIMSQAYFQAGDPGAAISQLEKGAKASPGDQTLQMVLARGYLSAGKIQEAIEALEQLPQTKQGPYRREVLLILAYLRKNDVKHALLESKKLLASRPDDAGVHNLVSAVYMVSGQKRQARRQLMRSLTLEPTNRATLFILGRLDYQEGRRDDAQARFEKILAIEPKNAKVMTALAQLAAAAGDESGMFDWLERARAADSHAVRPRLLLVRYYLAKQDSERAQKVGAEVVAAAPQSTQVLTALGAAQSSGGAHQEALTSFTRALETAPWSADLHYNAARAHLALGNVAQAKQDLSRALELEPDHIAAIGAFAFIEAREGNSKQALRKARKLQQHQPKSPAGYSLEGDLHMLDGKPAAAIRAYEAGSKRSASRGLAVKAYAARRQAKVADPYRPLTRWLRAHPDDHATRFLLAQAYQQDKQHKAAIAQYQRIVKARPKNALALNNLAWLYHLQGDPRAVRTAERAHRLQPRNGAITDTLGWLL
ncbi:MAG: XrtA/PEP-CTERM system TPR-repeat protein PrsT, partial [Acidiferrobacterales bacterium]